MQSPEVIYIQLIKDNILYAVVDKPKITGDYFKGIIDRLKAERTNMDRIITFCKTYTDVIKIYQYFKQQLGVPLNLQDQLTL